jgi:hypothetical protein
MTPRDRWRGGGVGGRVAEDRGSTETDRQQHFASQRHRDVASLEQRCSTTLNTTSCEHAREPACRSGKHFRRDLTRRAAMDA